MKSRRLSLLLITTLGLLAAAVANANPSPDYVRANAVELNSSDLSSIYPHLKNFKVITVGEMHGSQEIPALLNDLYNTLSSKTSDVVLGLEIPIEDQTAIETFVRTKNRNVIKSLPFFTRTGQDGRSSEAMVQLLELLPPNAKVICFDYPNASSGQERDEMMAKNLISALKTMKVRHLLVLAGNVHSAIEVGTPFDVNYRPMGYELHAQPNSPVKQTDIKAIRARYKGGTIWACMGNTDADCKVHTLNPPSTVYDSAVTFNRYFLNESLEQGYNGTVFIRSLTASPPAFN